MMGFFVSPTFRLKRRMASVHNPKSQLSTHSHSLNHCKYHNLKEAIQILQITDNWVDSSAYVSLLQGCIRRKSLPHGKLVHAHFNQTGFIAGILMVNTLINMYFKSGSMVDACRVFNQMAERNVCSWTIMIAGYAKHGFPEEALALFRQMQRTGIQPNQFTYASVLPAYAILGSPEEAVKIHEEIIRNGFLSDVFVANALIDMYAKCGIIETARDVFDKMPEPNMVSWTTMIAGYVQIGCLDEALQVFRNMPQRNLFSCTAMITGYAQNGFVGEALKLFKEIPKPDVVSWNAMIAGFAQSSHGRQALEIFQQMQLAGVEPDSKTFSSILSACANFASLEQGMEIHERIIRSGFQCNVTVLNTLIDMYAKCGSVQIAHAIFEKMHQRDVVSWTTVIAGCTHNGLDKEALKFFWQMHLAGVKPDSMTFTSILPACANLGALEQGMEVHENIIRSGYQFDSVVENSLIDMYAKCGSIQKARDIFDKMLWQDVVSWTAMIAGYAQNGWGEEALKLFHQMQPAGMTPNSKTFSSVLSACANFAALEQGMEVHGKIMKCGFQSDVTVGNALMDMYAKCGSIPEARELFDTMHQRDAVSWTAMIAGYAMHGCGNEALKLFEQMKHSGLSPDHVTFVCVLSACCHAGLVHEGYQYFNCMSNCYHITPSMEHYSCMVGLLGRAGHLDEAEDFINRMPIKPDATVWSSLLGACRIHNNIQLGEYVAEHIFELDPKNAAPYVLLSNIFAAAGKWGGIEKVRKLMKDRGIEKIPGCSWIEINNQVHAFVTGHGSHQE